MQSLLLEKIKSKQACLGVIGLGYVGLPLAVDMAEAGFDTIGFDVKEAKLELIKKGCSYNSDVTDDSLCVVVKSQKLLATSDFSLLANCYYCLLNSCFLFFHKNNFCHNIFLL